MLEGMESWDDETWNQHERELRLFSYQERKRHALSCEREIENKRIQIACLERSARLALYEISIADAR